MIKNLILLLVVSATLQNKQFSYDELVGKANIEFYGDGYKLQKEANKAYLLMKEAAKKEGITIKIVSSYRSFEHQKRIWTRKYKKYISQGLPPTKVIEKIIEYSTIPGTSRHHWGTDIDIVDGSKKAPKSLLEAKNFEKDRVYEDLKKWMDENANKYGFYLVYTNKSSRKGFKYEPWHYSYKPISKPMLKQYLAMDIHKLLNSENLLGNNYFSEKFITTYINENICDINKALK